jgi:cell division protein FtsW (lipid II flippase)
LLTEFERAEAKKMNSFLEVLLGIVAGGICFVALHKLVTHKKDKGTPVYKVVGELLAGITGLSVLLISVIPAPVLFWRAYILGFSGCLLLALLLDVFRAVYHRHKTEVLK